MTAVSINKKFKVTILSLYTQPLGVALLDYSILKRARDKGIWDLKLVDIRDFANSKHNKVDDYVFGGGPGQLLKPDVLSRAIDSSIQEGSSANLVLLSPAGNLLNQNIVKNLVKKDGITIICGHFEGIDYRIVDKYSPLQISVGDYIMSGGEIGAVALTDACVRLLDGALGSKDSLQDESFENIILEAPQYTRPFVFEEMKVPEVLISGNHAKINKWKKLAALKLTAKNRPDLLAEYKKKHVKSVNKEKKSE